MKNFRTATGLTRNEQEVISKVRQTALCYDAPSTYVNQTELSGNCGVAVLYDLSPKDTARSQFKKIVDTLDITSWDGQDEDSGYGQVMISDTVKSKNWEFTKKHAKKGVVSYNPNSGNKIQVYVVGPREVLAMAKALRRSRK